MIRVALVDDQAIVRAGLARILSPDDGFEIVAECVDGRQAVEELPALHPDVVLMDVRMPALDGIAATALLRGLEDPLRVLVLTTFGEDEVLWGAIEAGAAGFVLKDSSAEDLIVAVRAVAGGGPGSTRRSRPGCSTVIAGWWLPPPVTWLGLDLLTDREHDVLRLMARGATNAEIAGALHVAEATVKTHVGSIFGKLGVRDRAAAIVFAYDHGVVTPGVAPPRRALSRCDAVPPFARATKAPCRPYSELPAGSGGRSERSSRRHVARRCGGARPDLIGARPSS